MYSMSRKSGLQSAYGFTRGASQEICTNSAQREGNDAQGVRTAAAFLLEELGLWC